MEVFLEKPVYGGKNLARTPEGKAIFVSGGLAGQKVLIELIKEKKSYLEARAIKVLQAASNERQSPCAFFPVCGGCLYLPIDEKRQWEWKKNFVAENLLKIAKVDINTIFVQEFPAPNGLHYRHRIQLRGTFYEDGSISCGFLKSGSHEQVAIDSCAIAHLGLKRVLFDLPQIKLTPKNKTGKFRLELQVLPELYSNGVPFVIALAIEVTPAFGAMDELIAALSTHPDIAKVQLKTQKISHASGDFLPFYNYEGISFFTLPGAFQQVYLEQNIILKHLVNSWIKEKERANEKILDLYAGSGNLSLSQAKEKDVIAVECSKESVLIGKHNAAFNKLSRIKFIQSSTEDFLKQNKEYFPIVLADPARAGMKEAIEYLIKMKPRVLIYISCDLATAARDVLQLKEVFTLKKIAILDFFPQTYHVETAFLFENCS